MSHSKNEAQTYSAAFFIIAGMECCVPGCTKQSGPPDHVKTVGSGGKDRKNLIPVCYKHHTERHNKGRKTFEDKYGIELAQIAEETWTKLSEVIQSVNLELREKGMTYLTTHTWW